MLHSAVTVSLVAEAKGGPFVFWDDLPAACAQAQRLGFDAIELFAPGPDAVSQETLASLLTAHRLSLAAVGTGAGWVKHKLSLTSSDSNVRQRAIDFIRSMIDFGGVHKAPAIIGSMQGRWGDGVSREQALEWLREGLNQLGEHARRHGVPLIYEPLNRYETNLVNTVAGGVELMESLNTNNVRLLADLFHMNIEESDLPTAITRGHQWIGHIHFVDSNRRPAGCGHIDFESIAKALKDSSYAGYLSAEALPWPDSLAAAEKTILEYRRVKQVVG